MSGPAAERFDVVVIGAGSAGLTAAEFSVQTGRKTLLVEAEKLGGDCTWYGCVPSKSLLHQAAVARGLGTKADMQQVHGYVHAQIQEVAALEDVAALEAKGVKVLLGEARFLDRRTVEVGERTIRAKYFIVCTGALPKFPSSVAGLEALSPPAWDYQSVWSVTELPRRLAVIGTGPIGSELSQAFARLGSEVTIIGSKLLPREVEPARKAVLESFEADGIKFANSRPVAVETQADGSLLLTLTDGTSMEVDKILYSIGRAPVLPAGLADVLGAAGVGPQGGLLVKPSLRSASASAANIYAAGDCIDENLQFTHYAGFQGFTAVRNALLPFSSVGDAPRNVPRVTFTDPEVGAVGLNTVEAARSNGFPKAVAVFRGGAHIDRAVCDDVASATFVELVLANGTSTSARIVGGNAVGPRAGETLCELALCVSAKLTLLQLASTVHPYPTYGFALNQLAFEEVTKRLLASTTGKLAVRGCSIL